MSGAHVKFSLTDGQILRLFARVPRCNLCASDRYSRSHIMNEFHIGARLAHASTRIAQGAARGRHRARHGPRIPVRLLHRLIDPENPHVKRQSRYLGPAACGGTGQARAACPGRRLRRPHHGARTIPLGDNGTLLRELAARADTLRRCRSNGRRRAARPRTPRGPPNGLQIDNFDLIGAHRLAEKRAADAAEAFRAVGGEPEDAAAAMGRCASRQRLA